MLSFCLDKKGIWLFSFSFGLTSLPYLFAKVRLVGSCLDIFDDRRKVFFRIANSGKVTQHWPNLGGVSRMEPDFERLLQFFPVLGTTDLTKPVIQVKKEKLGRIMDQKNCQTTCQLIRPVVGLSNWAPAYCQETCLL